MHAAAARQVLERRLLKLYEEGSGDGTRLLEEHGRTLWRDAVGACVLRGPCLNTTSLSRSNSTVEGSIAHGGQNQPRPRLGEGLVRHEVHAPVEKLLQQLVQGEEVIVRALGVFELHVDVHVAVIARLATGEGAEDAHTSGSERAQFGIVGLNNGQWVHRTVSMLCCTGPAFKQAASAANGSGEDG